jgi:IPT/TIG domain
VGLRGLLSYLVVLACLALGAAGAAGGSPPTHRISGIVPPFGKAPQVVTSDTARGGCHGPSRQADCGLLRYGGGPVMHTSTVYTIFWQPTGYTSWDGQPAYSAGYQSLIARYFQDLAADSGLLTNVYGADTQYCSGAPIGLAGCTGVAADNFITTDVTYGGSWTDTQSFPANGCSDPFAAASHCLTDDQITAEIQHAIAVNSGNGWTASATNMFFVYTPRGVQTCVDDGGPFGTCAYNVYCAYHANVGTGGNALIYANMAYPLFGNLDVCRDAEHVQEPNGDLADAVLSLTSHEHAEAITDPEPFGGWLDAEDFVTGGENGDKCSYYYGRPTGHNGSQHNQVINGHEYYLQLEWSNADTDCVASYSPGSVSKLSPSHGVVGQPVRLGGHKLTDVTGVDFGGTAASSVVENAGKVTAVLAPGATSGPVRVTTGHGVIDGPDFTVDPSPLPAITSFTKKSAAGKTVTVNGSGFWGASSVQVGGVDVESFAVRSETKLTFVVAAGNTTGQIAVTTPGGTAVSAAPLTIS